MDTLHQKVSESPWGGHTLRKANTRVGEWCTANGGARGLLLAAITPAPARAGIKALQMALQSGVAALGMVREPCPADCALQALQAVERERWRISRDLHDGVAPTLAGLALLAGSLSNTLKREGLAACETAERLGQEMQRVMRDIRRVIDDLAPAELDQTGLCGALRRLVGDLSQWTTTRMTFHAPREHGLNNPLVEEQLLRIGQEALHNALQHAQASLIVTRLEIDASTIQLSITDDGRGFKLADRFDDGMVDGARGRGLRNMTHRARLIGASLDIRSGSESGTCVVCRLSNLG